MGQSAPEDLPYRQHLLGLQDRSAPAVRQARSLRVPVHLPGRQDPVLRLLR